MYLGAANNNLASTALAFFQQSVEHYGFPLRYLNKQVFAATAMYIVK